MVNSNRDKIAIPILAMLRIVREPVKNYLVFFPLRGGGTPLSAKGFWAGGFSIKGGRGVPLNSGKENSAEKQVF